MEFKIKKVNNCFKDAETYEYSIGCNSCELLSVFENMGRLNVNSRLRRPVFTLDMDSGVNIKGILAEPVLRASFRDTRQKAEFETWLSGLEVGK